MIKVLLNGCKGRIGMTLCSMIESDDYNQTLQVCAGIDAVGGGHFPFPFYTDINDCDMPSDVIIDFSIARAVPGVIDYAVKTKTPLLICTTGLSDDTIEKINEAAKVIPVFRSGNMSLGVNLLVNLIEKAVSVLGDAGFDIEIVERHHNQKIDSPSGTAYMLAEAANDAANGKYEFVYGRRPEDYKKRGKNELGIHSVRGGTIIGDHSIVFAGNDEVIELSHSAFSKNVFAQGAVKAAKFLVGKSPGLYSMKELMESE